MQSKEFEKIAACLQINFSARKGWKQTSVDRKASDKTADENAAEKKAVRVLKKLFDNPTTKAINSLIAATRDEIQRATLPTDCESRYLLPCGQFERVKAILDNASIELEKLTMELADIYPSLLDQAKASLGNLWDESQYPTAEQVKARTKFSYSFEPVADSSRFAELIDVSSIADELTAMHANRLADQARLATTELESRLHNAALTAVRIVVSFHHGGQRLSKNVVSNLQAAIDNVRPLVFLAESSVAQTCDDLSQVCGSYDSDSLRDPAVAARFATAIRQAIDIVEPAAVEPIAVEPATVEPVASGPSAIDIATVFVPCSIDEFVL